MPLRGFTCGTVVVSDTVTTVVLKNVATVVTDTVEAATLGLVTITVLVANLLTVEV
jgi:hypothetical protein